MFQTPVAFEELIYVINAFFRKFLNAFMAEVDII